jgi:hypothetical protein
MVRFVNCGFRPAFIMFKRTDSADGWAMYDNKRDPYNVNSKRLEADSSGTEATAAGFYHDFLSNGVKIRGTSPSFNASGGTYIYMAFGGIPFQGDDGVTQGRAR